MLPLLLEVQLALRGAHAAPGASKRVHGMQATLVGQELWVFGGEDATRRPLDDLFCLDLGAARSLVLLPLSDWRLGLGHVDVFRQTQGAVSRHA